MQGNKRFVVFSTLTASAGQASGTQWSGEISDWDYNRVISCSRLRPLHSAKASVPDSPSIAIGAARDRLR